MQGTLGLVLAVAGILFLSWLFLVALFTPAVNYRVRQPANVASAEFLYLLQSTCPSALYEHNSIEILRNGDHFYPAMLEAIRRAEHSVCLECYIFEDGEYRPPLHRGARRACPGGGRGDGDGGCARSHGRASGEAERSAGGRRRGSLLPAGEVVLAPTHQ